MDKVQFQLESTLPELKDLHEKGLFSRIEINQITKRRTQFESGLIKKGNSKEDFFRYAEYEIGLETLRRVRWKRLGYDKDPPPPSASSFSIPRRVMYILKRATAKYPADLATWLAYIEYAGRERMRKIVSKGLTSALQHHPLSATLYLLSSFNHLHPGAPFPRSAVPIETSFALPSSSSSTAKVSAEEEDELANSYAIEGTQPARTTLLLGLRMLPNSHDLWREYIKLELQWVEVLRRRWKVLGIDGGAEGIVGGEGAFGEGGEEARKAILAGQLVLQAVQSSLEGVKAGEPEQLSGEKSGMAYRRGLLDMLRTYPSPLRIKSLEVVYADLERVTGQQQGQAKLLLLSKGLYDRPYDPAVKDEGGVVLQGVELVEELGKVGKAIKGATKTAGPAFGLLAGRWLDERIRETDNDDLYLLSILASLAKPALSPSSELVILHMSHLSLPPRERFALLEKHTAQNPTNAPLQLLRLRALLETQVTESTSSAQPLSDAAYTKAEDIARAVSRTPSDMSVEDAGAVSAIWTEWFDAAPVDKHHAILLLSLRQDCASLVHPALLSRFYAANRSTQSPISLLHTIRQKYRPSPAFYSTILDSLSPSDHAVAKVAYEHWTRTCTTAEERVEAGLTYAGLLMRARKGRQAGEVVGKVRMEVKGDGQAAEVLERGWEGICRLVEEEGEEESEEKMDGEEGSESESEGGLDVDGDVDM